MNVQSAPFQPRSFEQKKAWFSIQDVYSFDALLTSDKDRNIRIKGAREAISKTDETGEMDYLRMAGIHQADLPIEDGQQEDEENVQQFGPPPQMGIQIPIMGPSYMMPAMPMGAQNMNGFANLIPASFGMPNQGYNLPPSLLFSAEAPENTKRMENKDK